ncbi:MAG: radical SAM protein [Thermoproteaceae archaeon]|nr:radical SAM protein [Thermoproteaceae archaeon]
MIPVSVLVTGRGTVSFRVKGAYGVGRPSEFSGHLRPVIAWNLTWRCNLNCAHCYADAGTRRAELTTAEALRFVEQVAEINSPLLILSGGEPLMREDLPDIIRRAKELGIRVALSTNGTLISPAAARVLAKLEVDYIGVSLDSAEERFHDSFRGLPGAFKAAINGTRNAIAAELSVGLRFTVTAKNIHQAGQYVDFAASLGALRVVFYHLSAAGRARALGSDWWYTPQQYATFMETLVAKAREYAGRLEIETALGPFDGVYLALILGGSSLREYLEFVRLSGGCGRKIVSVHPDGSVYPCQFVDFYRLGSVRESRLAEVLNPERLDPFINTDRYLRGPRCSACRFRHYCKGGDRARAYYLAGDMFGDDPLCPIPVLFGRLAAQE